MRVVLNLNKTLNWAYAIRPYDLKFWRKQRPYYNLKLGVNITPHKNYGTSNNYYRRK